MSDFELSQQIEKLTQPWNIDEIDRDGVTELLRILSSGNSSRLYELKSPFDFEK